MYQFVLPVRTPNWEDTEQGCPNCCTLYLADIEPRGRSADPLPEGVTVVELSLGPGTWPLPRHHPPGSGAAWSHRIRPWTANNMLLLLLRSLRQPEHILGATVQPEVRFPHLFYCEKISRGKRPSWTRVGKRLGGDGGGRCHRTSAANGV